MTLRAFLIGLLTVAGVCFLAPYNDWGMGNTYITGFHFPTGPFFLLVLLTVVGNLMVKLFRKAWALSQSELMLVWCMLIVASTVPSSGLMRYAYPLMAAPSYYAESPTNQKWLERGHVLQQTPEQVVVSKESGNYAAKLFFQGSESGAEVNIPWGAWVKPLVTWGIFLLLYYLATMFLCSILRGRWVESERLTFPIAEIPMELTEGSKEKQLIPSMIRNPLFLIGAAISLVTGLIRLSPVIDSPRFSLAQITGGTFLEAGHFGWAYIFPLAIGVAYLLPAQISFSVWFFWLISRFEFVAASRAGTPLVGGNYGPFMKWQQAAAFVAFTAVMIWKARHHIATIAKKAMGRGHSIDDSDEIISYSLSFWGFVGSVFGLIGWFWYFGMNPLVGMLLLMLMMSLLLVHARLVAQGGLFFVQQNWAPVEITHSLTGGFGLSAPALVVANMQHAMLLSDAREVFSPHAMNALRISSVFKKHRRLFLPAMLAALVLGLGVAGWASMNVYYSEGANNVNAYGPQRLAPNTFKTAERMIMQPEQTSEILWVPSIIGSSVMIGLMALRSHFYWLPIHPLGFLVATTYAMGTMWFSFVLGWLAKTIIMYFGGGGAMRKGRRFFLGVIVMEACLVSICAVIGFIIGEKVGGMMFLPG